MHFSTSFWLVFALGTYGVGALGAILWHGRPERARWAGYVPPVIAGAAGGLAALSCLDGQTVSPEAIFQVTPYLPVVVGLDPLAAWFLLALSALAVAISLAALGYARDHDHHGGPRLAVAYNLFLASMLLVLVLDSAFAFLIAWEGMSLASYVLVVHDHQRSEVRRAGFVYLAMTHLGTVFLILAFLGLANGGPLDFASLRAAGRALDANARALIFLFAFTGFGVKAGLIPLHVWLPRAHPIAPSHVSALMSGVMLKIAIYGFVRVTFDLLGGGPAWWGGAVLIAGLVSAVLGVLFAFMQHDLKTLLAYHSVENVGIIFIGLGTAILLAAQGNGPYAALALAAGLFHVLNHALFKALLFLGAGAIDQATGTKDLERLGGLIHRMPQTAALFLIGAVAISALPPLNGFASEWLAFQGLLALATVSSSVGIQLGAVVAAGLLALTGALAAGCFVKAFGISFLALPRSAEASGAKESPVMLRIGMLPLAVACVVLGLVPGLATSALSRVSIALVRADLPTTSMFSLDGAEGQIIPLGVLGGLIALAALPMVALRWFGSVPHRRAPTWACGWQLEPEMQYGATAFAKPVRLFFRAILRPERLVERSFALEPLIVQRVRYEAWIPHHFERHLYSPLMQNLLRLANALRSLQSGSLRLYVAYVLATLIVLLILAR